MNKISKRVVAGASAVALLVSAVGADQFADLFMKTSFAKGSDGKFAQSTGFLNLEQDTTTGNEKYNTGYGLHTNKTAKEVGSDGRTFDVDLESWYVGENPVDVATILDASGSMAWTVDTLSPLEISFNYDDVAKYLKDENDLNKYSIDNKETRLLTAIQDENGGYLPQEVVDLILDPTKTDNTKLSYAGYKYYVYEARSSVSEFVPLGYWDGGSPLNDDSLIGYYPFENSLENTKGGEAKYIKHAADNTSNKFDESQMPFVTVEPSYVKKSDGSLDATLDITETAEKGALMADVKATGSFTVAMRVKAGEILSSGTGVDNTPLVYIGNGKDNYISVYRNGGGNDPRRLKVTVNGDEVENIGNLFQKESTDSTTNKKLGSNNWINISLTYDDSTKKVSVDLSVNGKAKVDGTETVSNHFDIDVSTYSLNFDKADIIIGGDVVNDTHVNPYTNTQLTAFCVFGEAVDPFDITTIIDGKNISDYSKMQTLGDLTAFYDFGDSDSSNRLGNRVDGVTGSLKFIEQAEGKTFSGKELASGPAEPVYSSDNYSGGHSLNVSQTAKLGSVLLDAHPTSKKYTLTFAIKKNKDSTNDNNNFEHNAEIMYIGSSNLDDKDYYSIKRHNHTLSSSTDNRHLRFYKGDKSFGNADISDVFQSNNDNIKWSYITYVFDNGKLRVYKDGEKAPNPSGGSIEELDCAALTTETINFIIAGLKDEYDGSDILLDDLYVFDDALTETEVSLYFGSGDDCKAAKDGNKTHARTIVTKDGKQEIVDIAQIANGDNRLGKNTNAEERRGWYYVNSASDWADIEGCLESGKQYVGIFTDKGFEDTEFEGMANDTATEPTGYAEGNEYLTSIRNGNNDTEKYKAPTTERSIRFYVDEKGHLRCFVWSGSDTKSEGDERTFCSIVYEKGVNNNNKDQITKYEELNNALNTFYQNIAKKSDLSNNSIVRFSTNNAVIKDNETTTNENLKKLIMKEWTNWSDYYQKVVADGDTPDTKNYLQNLLIPADGETAVPAEGTEYPYVMTGGTYTWTGLKAFYDNMVKNEDSQTAKDIANDARDKYLIIFTDGRDNTQDYNVSEEKAEEHIKDTTINLAGSPKYSADDIKGTAFEKTDYVKNYNPYKDDPDHKVGFSIKNYGNNWGSGDAYPRYQVQQFITGDHEIATDGDLAEAWADKLKDEGYTIYCVMMATGSISEKANADEYNKAKNFLKSLSGSNELDAEIAQMQNAIDYGNKPDGIAEEQKKIEALRDNYVIVVDPTTTGGMTVTDAFQQILEDIQKPREDYTVQDYIDSRFDLVDVNDNVYHLGAGGHITVTDKDGKAITTDLKLSNGRTFTNGSAVGNIIDSIDKDTTATGLAYTPVDSYMVNRTSSDDTGNKIGTGYLYYDDVKDMYYLRWTDQIIPMENKAFDTDKEPTVGKTLNVWSATIRLKAKDDFIGGNNILTNGNEAGENLVYSDATIENMDKGTNYLLYGLKEDSTYREKLQVLSGTDRKINAVDAGGVSQAVYGDGIDIPSSGFPRTTVNVRLLKLNANNLNDVIYMGEVVSPTMMLADLENGYMTGSYYLEYLERYAYRVYGEDVGNMPLIELLNKWLKIDDKNFAAKTFTIPYIYLPDPEYGEDGKLSKPDGKIVIKNSTGATIDPTTGAVDFSDLNLRDVTGFITYTWERADGNTEDQQKMDDGSGDYDITKDYVVKNTDQIVYNLQLKFTPLKETAAGLSDFKLDKNFIKGEGSEPGDKFFNIGTDGEFADYTPLTDTDGWTTDYGRENYLQAMIKEERTYEPHVIYDESTKKWKLITEADKTTALAKYAEDDQTEDVGDGKITDHGVYDWNNTYKPAEGEVQIVNGKLNEYYTNTPDSVNISDDKLSLEANTTYTKDVVNAALALELFVDGKYLQGTDQIIKVGSEYKFIATRYYDDPIDPPPYDEDLIGADTPVAGQKYQLTFTVDEIPAGTKSDEIYKVWATLTKVEVLDSSSNEYSIDTKTDDTSVTDENIKSFLGYEKADSLPIGTYVIECTNEGAGNNSLENSQFEIGTEVDGITPINFKYLKTDKDKNSYTYDKFPESVYQESDTAAKSTKDGEYLIWNDTTDYSKKNIAENTRVKDTVKQTVTFYFGTVAEKTVSEDTTLTNTKGVSVKEYLKENPDDPTLAEFKNDYAKDRLGIIMLSADNNSLAITKKVDNTSNPDDKTHSWKFTVTVKPDGSEAIGEFDDQNATGFTLKWYNLVGEDSWELENPTSAEHSETITFTKGSYGTYTTYTADIYLKHGEKVVIEGLPEGKWQVVEDPDVFCTPHNDQSVYDEDEWRYNKAESTLTDIELNPASQVNYINEFPYELPSTGGSGIVWYIVIGTALTAVGMTLFAVLYFDRKKKVRK